MSESSSYFLHVNGLKIAADDLRRDIDCFIGRESSELLAEGAEVVRALTLDQDNHLVTQCRETTMLSATPLYSDEVVSAFVRMQAQKRGSGLGLMSSEAVLTGLESGRQFLRSTLLQNVGSRITELFTWHARGFSNPEIRWKVASMVIDQYFGQARDKRAFTTLPGFESVVRIPRQLQGVLDTSSATEQEYATIARRVVGQLERQRNAGSRRTAR